MSSNHALFTKEGKILLAAGNANKIIECSMKKKKIQRYVNISTSSLFDRAD